MAAIREWLIRLWGTVWRRRADADLEHELRTHLELAAEDEWRRHPGGDARRAAAIRSGRVTPAMEILRQQRGLPWLEQLFLDGRYGMRALRRTPLFAAVAISTLALGIGANVAVYSLADAVLLRNLPVTRPRDLVLLRQRGPMGDMFPFTSSAAEHLGATRDVLAGVAAFRPLPGAPITLNGEAELTAMQLVSSNYHELLGVAATVGRTLTARDRDPVAVISHNYWQRRFAGDPRAVGRVLEIQRRTFTIVGVTPPDFFGMQPGLAIDVTIPLGTQSQQMPPNARWLYLIGRLAPGVSIEQARSALGVRWAQLADSSIAKGPVALELDSGAKGLNELRREFSLPLHILMTIVGVVLLVACANLAGLLIVRSTARQHEIAVRLSVGASRRRIAQQLITESALLALSGGGAGFWFAEWLTPLLVSMMSRGRTPIIIDVSPNSRTLVFAVVVTMATILLFGLLPAVAATRRDVQSSLRQTAKSGDATPRLWSRTMVSLQVALLVVLLTAAGLFARTLAKLRSVDTGIHPENVLVVNVATGAASRGPSARTLYDDLSARFSVLPSVESVSRSMDTPLVGEPSMSSTGISIPGQPIRLDDEPRVYHNVVGPRFFRTMGIAIVAGRDFDFTDDERSPASVIVSERLVRRYFPANDPLGRQITFGNSTATIVGVVKDVRYTSLRGDAPLFTYRPCQQIANAPANTFVIRTSSPNADTLAPLLRAEVRAAAPALPPPTVVRLDDRFAGVLRDERMLAVLSSALGLLASVLAAIGIYSTIAAIVARRRREIGIRMALGAVSSRIARMVFSEAFTVVGAGIVVGIGAALIMAALARPVLTSVLFELSPADPAVLVVSIAMILSVAAVAAYLPARRASRIDPAAALKGD